MGLRSADDAAVWRLDDDRALVFTADFFTPVVDDPFAYGEIAAANALSDVYAMGGKPFLALNLAAMPAELPEEIIAEIVRGSATKVQEAGAIVAGGHTIDDDEPKFGLAVLGFVHPDRIGTKGGARPGDALVLTKPLGSGIITTAYKADLAAADHIAEATRWMSLLNRNAAAALEGLDVHAVTDVTGFGLLGHAWEMASRGDGARLVFRFSALPFQSGAQQYADDLLFPAMANKNQADYGPHVHFADHLEYEQQLLPFSPETSGGLLICLAPDQADAFQSRLSASGGASWAIGHVMDGPAQIEVR